jgi:hypothetical protein
VKTSTLAFVKLLFFEIENRKHTGHNATVEQSRLSLVDEHGSCQGNGDKINDTATSKKENSKRNEYIKVNVYCNALINKQRQQKERSNLR